MDGRIGSARLVTVAKGNTKRPANDRERLREIGRGIAEADQANKERYMTDKQQAGAAPNQFTAAMDMIGGIGSRVAAYRK